MLAKIAEGHPRLGEHLTATVRRGYFCVYRPSRSAGLVGRLNRTSRPVHSLPAEKESVRCESSHRTPDGDVNPDMKSHARCATFTPSLLK